MSVVRSVRFPDGLLDEVAKYAAEQGVSPNEYMVGAIRALVECDQDIASEVVTQDEGVTQPVTQVEQPHRHRPSGSGREVMVKGRRMTIPVCECGQEMVGRVG